MMNALMDSLTPLGYHAVPQMTNELEDIIRNEFYKPNPRRLMVLHHNKVTKNMHPRHNQAAIIADTVRDGFKQVTGYCRYMRGVKTCGEDMLTCLRSNSSIEQNLYRWGGRQEEDVDTYIDLPLASDYPALSTTVLRSVFDSNVTLKLARYNVRSKSCDPDKDQEGKIAKELYDTLYQPLDEQIMTLRKRMLVIAGYPYNVDKEVKASVGLEDMMQAADDLENLKYGIGEPKMAPRGKSGQVKQLLRKLQMWRKVDGKLVLVARREV